MKISLTSLLLFSFLVACNNRPDKPSFGSDSSAKGKNPGGVGTGNQTGIDSSEKATDNGPAVKANNDQMLRELEFSRFIKELDANESDAQLRLQFMPMLLLKSQLAYTAIGEEAKTAFAADEETATPQGRCLIFNASGTALESSDLKASTAEIADNGYVALSKSKTMKPEDCNGFFKGELQARMEKDYFRLFPVFYQLN